MRLKVPLTWPWLTRAAGLTVTEELIESLQLISAEDLVGDDHVVSKEKRRLKIQNPFQNYVFQILTRSRGGISFAGE